MSNILYTIKKSRRARRISITVRYSGDVVVTMPLLMPAFVAAQFVEKKKSWIQATQEKFKKRFENKTIISQKKTDYLKDKKRALDFVTERVHHYNKIYNFKVGRISVKNQKSRWGSCSSKGNLNFNFSLVNLPLELADYIVVHELCHIKELNHGKKFWELVAVAMPDYKTRRAVLKQNYIGIQ